MPLKWSEWRRSQKERPHGTMTARRSQGIRPHGRGPATMPKWLLDLALHSTAAALAWLHDDKTPEDGENWWTPADELAAVKHLREVWREGHPA